MNIQHTGHAGKTKIIIATEGCTFCGTTHASGWVEAGTMEVRLRTKTLTVSISACVDCWNIQVAKFFPGAAKAA